MNSLNIRKGSEKGFTLLELLIVISIIAILSVALVLVLNPAEALKKSRDAQRISDLSTMKTALGLYLTSTTTPQLDNTVGNTTCETTMEIPTNTYYSYVGGTTLTAAGGGTTHKKASAAAASLTDGTGWIPVNFDSLTGGSPISNLPLDPSNTIGAAAMTNALTDDANLVYRYACLKSPLSFEINAQLESAAYTTGSDDKRASDGGNNVRLYEVGTNLRILPDLTTY